MRIRGALMDRDLAVIVTMWPTLTIVGKAELLRVAAVTTETTEVKAFGDENRR